MKKLIKLFTSIGVLILTILSLTVSITVNAVELTKDNYYDSITETEGEALLSQLATRVSTDTIRKTYNDAFDCYTTTDTKLGTDIIWDIYSNTNYKSNDPYFKGTSIAGEGTSYNREHAVCQSWIKTDSDYITTVDGKTSNTNDSKNPMYSDLFHLYPVDGYSNSYRNNNFFGEITGEVTYESSNGSKLGKGSTTFNYTESGKAVSTNVVFEITDEYKGDIARSYLYFVTRYKDRVGTLSAGAECMFKDSYPYLTPYAYNLFLKWNYQDPVSEKEIARNEAIFAIQNNRNPYIDNPDYVTEIFSGATGTDGYTYSDFTYVTPSVDTSKVNAVEALINAIPDGTLTYDNRDVIFAATNKYLSTLNDAEKAAVNDELETKMINAFKAVCDLDIPDPGNVTYTITSKATVNTTGEAPLYSTASYSCTVNNPGTQFTKDNSLTLTLTGFGNTKITKIGLLMKSNVSSGGGSLTISSGSVTKYTIADSKFNTSNWNSSWSGKPVYVTKDITPFTVKGGEDLTINVTASENSIYVFKISILYEDNTDGTSAGQLSKYGTKAGLNLDYCQYEKAVNKTYYELASTTEDLTNAYNQAKANNTSLKVAIAAKDYNYAISSVANDNNRKQAEITKNSNNTMSYNSESLVELFTLGAGTTTTTYSFKAASNSKYLYAASTGSNYLKYTQTLDAKGSFEISITNGVASVVSSDTTVHGVMKYNASTGIFSCYGTSNTMKNICIYIEKTGETTETHYLYENVNLTFGAIVDKDLILDLNPTEYGVEIYDGTNWVSYQATAKRVNIVNGYGVASTTGTHYLWTVSTPITASSYNTKIKAKAYVISEGNKVYLEEREESASSLASSYITSKTTNYNYLIDLVE